MLPNFYAQRYQEFATALSQLQQSVTEAQPSTAQIRQAFGVAQKYFQQQIVTLDSSTLAEKIEPKVRSYHTEMSKQLRLLGMDVMYLQAARQKETAIARLQQISDRAATLLGYCHALLNKQD